VSEQPAEKFRYPRRHRFSLNVYPFLLVKTFLRFDSCAIERPFVDVPRDRSGASAAVDRAGNAASGAAFGDVRSRRPSRRLPVRVREA
jgi:hypothetical protein